MRRMTPSPMISKSELLDRRRIWRFDHEAVRNARISCRCTQSRLADRLGISVRHLRRIETGVTYGAPEGLRIRTGETLHIIDAICFELGLEYEDVLAPLELCAA
jgi:transcriptional regulator with XRE-family HTH domain